MTTINERARRFEDAGKKELINSPHVVQMPSGGGAAVDKPVYYKVIEAPVMPTGDDPTGQNYYTLRPVSDTTKDYVAGTTYGAGAFVTDPDTDFMYESVQGDNIGHALTDEAWWSKQEEVKVDQIFRWPTGHDVRDFVPIIPKDVWVKVFSIIEVEVEIYFIDASFMYVGTAEERTIAMIENDAKDKYIVGAVFR